MIAKQYPIGLPTDYDMGIIRRRVREKGTIFDAWPGVLFKAFLISERSRGAAQNQYAPFYVWNDTGALWDFVAGDGFGGIVSSFGRPSILTWLPWSVEIREDLRRDAVLSASREDAPIPPRAALPAFRAEEIKRSRAAMASDPAIAISVTGANIEHWTAVRFTLRYDRPDTVEPDAQAFEVLHLATPGIG